MIEHVISASIIIPAWNEANTLEATLRALCEIEYDKTACEVILVAGGEDGTLEIAEQLTGRMRDFARYVVLVQEAHGKNAAIQKGIRESGGAIIVLLDADTLVTAKWLNEMVKPIEAGRCDLAVANPEPLRRNWISDYYMITKTYFLEKLSTYSGHSIAIRRAAVDGDLDYFFDAEVKVGVDYLLAKRVSESGRTTIFARNALVRTHTPSSVKYFVLCEMRWLTALTKIEGVDYKALVCNLIVVAAVIFAMPFSRSLFVLAWLFNALYVGRRLHMFFKAAKEYDTKFRRVFGFVLLSYGFHAVRLISYLGHFLGFTKGDYLYQGQRY